MTVMGPPVITYADLAAASLLILVAAGLSLWLKLGLGKTLVTAAARSVAQLALLGLALSWIFTNTAWWLTAMFIAVMVVVAAHTSRSRISKPPRGTFADTLLALAVPGVSITLAVTAGVMEVDPWYEPRYVLPVAGMIIGNAMSSVAVSLDRLFSELKADEHRINALLACGATPAEAGAAAVRNALRSGLIPIINAMSAAGIVFIPGMMTGQILSGADPMVAASYQVVVLLMISASTSLGTTIAVVLGRKKAFDGFERFIMGSHGSQGPSPSSGGKTPPPGSSPGKRSSSTTR